MSSNLELEVEAIDQGYQEEGYRQHDGELEHPKLQAAPMKWESLER